jgi:hypothetical protein
MSFLFLRQQRFCRRPRQNAAPAARVCIYRSSDILEYVGVVVKYTLILVIYLNQIKCNLSS